MNPATCFGRSPTNVFEPATEKYLMKKLLAALVAGMFAAATLTAFAADPVKSGGSTDKPGRAADEGKDSVKSGGSSDKPGRTADTEKKPTTTPATSTTSTTHKKKAKKPAAAPAAPKS
jgi:hypothetical protein